jgi:hypothetical protein
VNIHETIVLWVELEAHRRMLRLGWPAKGNDVAGPGVFARAAHDLAIAPDGKSALPVVRKDDSEKASVLTVLPRPEVGSAPRNEERGEHEARDSTHVAWHDV